MLLVLLQRLPRVVHGFGGRALVRSAVLSRAAQPVIVCVTVRVFFCCLVTMWLRVLYIVGGRGYLGK